MWEFLGFKLIGLSAFFCKSTIQFTVLVFCPYKRIVIEIRFKDSKTCRF